LPPGESVGGCCSLLLALTLTVFTASCASDATPSSAAGSDDEAAIVERDTSTDEPKPDPEEPAEPSSQLEPYVNAAAVEQPPPDGDDGAIANDVHTHLGYGLDIVRTAASTYRAGEPITRGPIPDAARHPDRAEDGIGALDAPELAEELRLPSSSAWFSQRSVPTGAASVGVPAAVLGTRRGGSAGLASG
jgi:hypothetical protein